MKKLIIILGLLCMAPVYSGRIIIEDEGVRLNPSKIINITGSGVECANINSKITCTITGGGQVNSVVAGSNVTVDSTDPANPIVSATASGGTSTHSNLSNLDFASSGHTDFAPSSVVTSLGVHTGLTGTNVHGLGTMATETAANYSTKLVADGLYTGIAHSGYTTTAHGGIEPTIVAGGAGQYWNGSKTWSSFSVTLFPLGDGRWNTLGHVHAYEPTIAGGTAGQVWHGDKTWSTMNFNQMAGYAGTANKYLLGDGTWGTVIQLTNPAGWITVGQVPPPASPWATVGAILTTGDGRWQTIGQNPGPWMTSGGVTALGDGRWLTLGATPAVPAATQSVLGGIKGAGSWTTCGAVGANYLMAGWQADGTVLCGPPGAGSLPPDGSKGDITVANSWNTLTFTAPTDPTTKMLRGDGWVTATGVTAGHLDSGHCASCHATMTIKAVTANAEYAWSSVGTLGETTLAWATMAANVINVANSSMRIVARGDVWTTVGGTGITKFSLKWGTIGATTAGSTEIGWATVSTALLVRVRTAYTFDCLVQWNSVAAAVTANASCIGNLGGTIAGSSWRTFTMDTTIGSKAQVATTQSPWTTAVGAFKRIGIGQLIVEKGNE